MMFGSVAGGLRIAKPPHWLQKSCQELLRRAGLGEARVGAWCCPCHWPLSHQHKLGLRGLASAARGESHFCRGARGSPGLWWQPQPTSWDSWLRRVAQGRPEQALGCCGSAGSMRSRASGQACVDAPPQWATHNLGHRLQGDSVTRCLAPRELLWWTYVGCFK